MADENIASLDIFTEIIHRKKTYRAHPNYRNGGPWYDWCMVRYEPSEADILREATNRVNNIASAYPSGYYPAKLLGFFMLHGNLHCIIHCTETKLNSDKDSCLTECWNLEYNQRRGNRNNTQRPLFRYCEVVCIEDRVFVVEESPGVWAELYDKSSCIVMVKHSRMWKDYFTDTS
jgi:hypothetical protein